MQTRLRLCYCLLFVGNVYVVGGDDVGALGNLLYLAVLGVGDTVEEVEHTKRGRAIEKLQVKYDGAIVKKVVCNSADLVEGLGSYHLAITIQSTKKGTLQFADTTRCSLQKNTAHLFTLSTKIR